MKRPSLHRLRCLVAQLAGNPRVTGRLMALVLLVLSVLLVHSALRKGGLWDTERHNDFRAYYMAAKHCLHGELHLAYAEADKPYQYPPALATLILPMGLLPEKLALVVWVLFMLGFLLWSFRVLDGVLCPPVKGVDKFFGFLLCYRMIESDFANTNANVLILGLLILGFRIARKERAFWSGVTLSLAAAIKVAPILLLPWILYQKRWRMAGGFLAGLLIWGVVVPGTILGPAEYGASMKAWYGGLLAPMNATDESYAEEAPGGYLPGQSLRPLLHRVLRPIDATAHDEDLISVNVLSLPKGTVDLFYLLISAAILLGLLAYFWRKKRNNIWGGAEIAIAIALLVLLSPLARKAHFVLLFPLATYGFMLARVAEAGRRKLSWGLWLGALGLIILTSPEVLGDAASAWALAFCPFFFAGVALGALPFVREEAA